MEASLTVKENPFLAAMQRVEGAVRSLQARFAVLALDLQGVQQAGAMFSAQFEKVRERFDMGKQLINLHNQTGQSVADLVILRQAFVNAGLGADDVGGKLNKFQKAIAGLNEDGEKTDHVLNELGTSVKAMSMMTAIQQIEALQKGFAGVRSQEDRVLLATKLFGKTGGSLLALFTSPEALSTARQQVGGMAETMQQSAELFRRLSEDVESVKIKFEQFWVGVASGVAPALSQVSHALSQLDFTSVGKMVGKVVAAFIELASVLRKLWPLLAGMAAQFAFVRMGALFTSLAGVARISFSAIASAGVSAARAIWSAFGPLGLAVAAASAAYMYFSDRAAAPGRENAAVGGISVEQKAQISGDQDAIKGLKKEEDRKKMAATLAEQLKAVQERMRNVNEEFSNLGDEGRGKIVQALAQWGIQLNKLKLALHAAPLHPDPLFALTKDTPIASRRRAAGGGRLGGIGGDPVVSELRRQTHLLQRIADGGKSASTRPAMHATAY